MKSKQANFAHSRKWLVAVCLLLILMLAVLQALHVHSGNVVNEAKHCPICQVVNSTVVVLLVLLLWFGLSATVRVNPLATPDPKSALQAFPLFSRPPPLA